MNVIKHPAGERIRELLLDLRTRDRDVGDLLLGRTPPPARPLHHHARVALSALRTRARRVWRDALAGAADVVESVVDEASMKTTATLKLADGSTVRLQVQPYPFEITILGVQEAPAPVLEDAPPAEPETPKRRRRASDAPAAS